MSKINDNNNKSCFNLKCAYPLFSLKWFFLGAASLSLTLNWRGWCGELLSDAYDEKQQLKMASSQVCMLAPFLRVFSTPLFHAWCSRARALSIVTLRIIRCMSSTVWRGAQWNEYLYRWNESKDKSRMTSWTCTQNYNVWNGVKQRTGTWVGTFIYEFRFKKRTSCLIQKMKKLLIAQLPWRDSRIFNGDSCEWLIPIQIMTNKLFSSVEMSFKVFKISKRVFNFRISKRKYNYQLS